MRALYANVPEASKLLVKSPVEAFQDEALKPDLLFDTADTISFEMAALLDRLNAEFGEEYTYWGTKQAHPLDISKKQKKWLEKVKDVPATYANLSPDWHAIDAMHALHIAGYHITISSNRPAEMKKVSKNWYDYWGVPYDDVEIDGPDSKEKVIKDHGPDKPIILFDDDPAQMLAFPRDGVEVWTQRKPWTPKDFLPANCFIFDSWTEVLQRLAPTFASATKVLDFTHRKLAGPMVVVTEYRADGSVKRSEERSLPEEVPSSQTSINLEDLARMRSDDGSSSLAI